MRFLDRHKVAVADHEPEYACVKIDHFVNVGDKHAHVTKRQFWSLTYFFFPRLVAPACVGYFIKGVSASNSCLGGAATIGKSLHFPIAGKCELPLDPPPRWRDPTKNLKVVRHGWGEADAAIHQEPFLCNM